MSQSVQGLIEAPQFTELGGRPSVLQVIRGKKGLSTSISESLGALVIGVLVLAGIGVGIGAAYNYTQDGAAKSTLDAVKSAETLHQSRSGSFGDASALTTGEDPALSQTPTNLAINVGAGGINYCAMVKSQSMFTKNYWITSKSGKILETVPTGAELTAGMTCPTTIPTV